MRFFIIYGLLSGMLIAAFFALGDGLFQTKTFIALIDVSYIPGLQGLHAMLELFIHLIVSIFVTAIFYLFYPKYKGHELLRYALIWMGIFSVLFFPMFILSEQPMSIAAFVIWELGHLLYTFLLIFLIEKYR